MKIITFFLTCMICFSTLAKPPENVSTIDFIQIKNNYKKEALYFYQNNWKKLREKAIEKGYIASYLLLETEVSEEAPFQIVLITTYIDKKQYNDREKNFAELMKESTGPKLLNSLTPNQFRKKLFSKKLAISL